jgi:hypothetical protein
MYVTFQLKSSKIVMFQFQFYLILRLWSLQETDWTVDLACSTLHSEDEYTPRQDIGDIFLTEPTGTNPAL